MLLLSGIGDPEAKSTPLVPLKFLKQSPWLKARSSLTQVSWALLREDDISQSRDSCPGAGSVIQDGIQCSQFGRVSQDFF